MEQPIKITADIVASNRNQCRFTVDRPVFPGGFARFSSADQASGSPLALKLFAIPGIQGVDIAEDAVTVAKGNPDDWPVVGKQIGQAIRDHLQSGQPAVTPEAVSKLPPDDQLRAKVQKILDNEINPAVASHGGYITLVDVRDKVLYIQMGGGCQGCGQANVTLREGIETSLKERIPEIAGILDSTDHDAGENPYY